MVEEQADLSVESITAVDHAQEVMEVHERHVRMYILGVRLEKLILQCYRRQSEGALEMEICDIFGRNLGGQRSNERRELRVGIMVLEGAEELGGAAVATREGRLTQAISGIGIGVRGWRPRWLDAGVDV